MNDTNHTPEAVALADAVLTATGSGLRHYSMAKTRDVILVAAQRGIDAGRAELLQALRTVVEMEYDRDPESRNFDDERLEHFASLIAKAEGRDE